MVNDHQIPLLFYLLALFALVCFVYNLRRFLVVRVGRKEIHRPIDIVSVIVNVLAFGIGQWKVMSKNFSYAAIMHFLLGWGFIELLFATTVDFFTARGWFVEYLPTLDTPWFASLNDLGGGMLLIGILLALYRRHVNKPVTLPQDSFRGRKNLLGDTGILLLLLVLVLGGFVAEASRLAIEQPVTARFSWLGYPLSITLSPAVWVSLKPYLWWSHAIASLLFIAILPQTKMFHTLTVMANIALTNRAKRGQVRPLYVSQLMEDPEIDIDTVTLGANQVNEFTWKQLLDSIACTECGRCTSVCPAFDTDKPLSPMKIITDIRHNLYPQSPWTEEGAQLIGGLVNEMELWSCTTCGACSEECPVLIDHVPTFTDMRRHLVLSEGKPPTQANESLEKTMNTGNPWGYAQTDRIKWATKAGIQLPIMAEKKKAQVLYWVGCAGAYDPRNQQVARAMVKILEKAGVDFAVLGTEETCTGDSARRIGEEYLFETMALQNIETLNKYDFDYIVTACPHCFHTIRNEYPDFGGKFEVQHHSQFINDLIKSGILNVERYLDKQITYHDACYLGRYNGVYDAPRSIIRRVLNSNASMIEMKRNKKQSYCCGAGGGNMWYDIDEGERINVNRVQQAIDTGAETLVTACSFCAIMLDDAMKVQGMDDTIQLLDIAELVVHSLEENMKAE